MHTLSVLYDASDHDDIFQFLKKAFAGAASDVSVTQIIPDEYAELSWSGDVEPSSVASELSAAVRGAVIEIPSTTGIDLKSRFFNNSQLW
jgi:hypothetical protein